MSKQARFNTFYLSTCVKTALSLGLLLSATPNFAQENNPEVSEDPIDVISVTGSRILRTEVTATSPVTSIDAQQIQIDQAVNVEDIIFKLPQAPSSGASSGSASIIDLRSLGQNRTLVLLNGTRAVPYGYRNSVDVNSLPAGLIKQVDVLTGGAAAVYGADAVAGVVNFVLEDDFDGFKVTSGYDMPDGGAETFNIEATFGSDILDDIGHVTGFVGYSDRSALYARERSFAMLNSTSTINTGGYYTDVASGNAFGINDDGDITSDENTVDVTGQSYLVPPKKRLSSGLFWDIDVSENAQLYGRAMYSNVKVTNAGSVGQTPVSVDETVTLTEDNPYLTDSISSLITFDENGEAQVNVYRNLGLGLQKTKTDRDQFQFQIGFKGELTEYLRYDMYFQHGLTDETATVYNSGYETDEDGNSTFAQIANSVDIFDPSVSLSELESTLLYSDAKRSQNVAAAVLTGESTSLFELPAGPVDFALGYEYRREAGEQTPGDAFSEGTSFSSGSASEMDASFYTKEVYAEVLVPLISGVAWAEQLDFEGAYRVSSYSNTEADDTYKLGLNWAVNSDWRIRWTKQSAFRAPNIGEFAGPISSLSLALFDPYSDQFISSFAGRFEGDPCLLGTGDADQCALFGAPEVGTEWDSSTAEYTYGGNPDIKPEKATSTTIGLVFTPDYIDGFDLTLDFYKIEITDAVSVIQPAVALQSCYIDNPTQNNSLCDAVERDATTGFISIAKVNDFNLARLLQEGADISANYRFDAPVFMSGKLTVNYSANLVTKLDKQLNTTVATTDCKGTYGSACSGDSASVLQADYKHRASLTWDVDQFKTQLSWRRIGDVNYASDQTISIAAQNYIDIAVRYAVTDALSVNVGIDNLFDKEAPVPSDGSDRFNTVSGYDVVGRTIGLTLHYQPEI
jgi:outer membrane receptor protein involved in Fe transport